VSKFERSVLALLGVIAVLLFLILLKPTGQGRYQPTHVGRIPVMMDTHTGDILRPN
jgi:hypothetical protein